MKYTHMYIHLRTCSYQVQLELLEGCVAEASHGPVSLPYKVKYELRSYTLVT